MRPFHDTEKRWSLLFNTSIGVDLRQAIRDDGDFDPCEEGLRSVCWKSFLLNGPLSKATWTRKLKDSRSGYTSLRDHFLKYIDNPNDLHSSADPLADDETSPWATLRQDEIAREEIWQDVIRCNVDNYFFREPATQRKLLDVLFIYAKLNPDTNYRQGMHELLAPILWVVHQDSVDVSRAPEAKKNAEGVDFMLNVLDSRFVEHDAFSLFCAVMQTAKSFYELGSANDSSAIVTHSERISDELLAVFDSDLSIHLQVIGLVPQIYAIRWLRLLFGRELDFKDLLRLWDALFAEGLKTEIIDMACVAILLRLRWTLIDADYTTAITTVSRLTLPGPEDAARNIVKDAIILARNQTAETGANITQLRTGKRQYTNPLAEEPIVRAPTPQSKSHRRFKSQQPSPSSSPARFATPQRHLEGLFNNVSSNFSRSTENWGVQNMSKALRGAVGEARRNFEQLQSGHSRTSSSVDVSQTPTTSGSTVAEQQVTMLQNQLRQVDERNKALAKMLDNAQEALRKWKSDGSQGQALGEDTFNTALAKMQFVSVYLADLEIPLPPMTPVVERSMASSDLQNQKLNLSTTSTVGAGAGNATTSASDSKVASQEPNRNSDDSKSVSSSAEKDAGSGKDPPGILVPGGKEASDRESKGVELDVEAQPVSKSTSSASQRTTRPSLAESSFSFMLGEDRHRSSFVKSTPLPEERRNSDAHKEQERKNSNDSKSRQQKHATKDRKQHAKPSTVGDESDEDGFTMSTLQ